MVEINATKRTPRKRVRRTTQTSNLLSNGVSRHLWNCLAVAVIGSIAGMCVFRGFVADKEIVSPFLKGIPTCVQFFYSFLLSVAFLMVQRHEARAHGLDTAVEGGAALHPIKRRLEENKPFLIYGTAWKEDKTAELVEHAVEVGFRFIDTAAQPKHYNEALGTFTSRLVVPWPLVALFSSP